MTNFEKLYIHLLTYGVERYGGKEGIKHIEELLEMDEQTLFANLHNAFNQAKRFRNSDNDFSEAIKMSDLKRIVLKQINKNR